MTTDNQEINESPFKKLTQNPWSVINLAVVLLLLLILVFYSPNEAIWSNSAINPEKINHPLGRFGAYSADLMFSILGYSVYLLPLAFLANGLNCLRKKSPGQPAFDGEVIFWRVFGLTMVLMALAALLSLYGNKPINTLATTGGGILGQKMAISFLNQYNKEISVFILLVILSCGLSLILPVRWRHLAHLIGYHLTQFFSSNKRQSLQMFHYQEMNFLNAQQKREQNLERHDYLHRENLEAMRFDAQRLGIKEAPMPMGAHAPIHLEQNLEAPPAMTSLEEESQPIIMPPLPQPLKVGSFSGGALTGISGVGEAPLQTAAAQPGPARDKAAQMKTQPAPAEPIQLGPAAQPQPLTPAAEPAAEPAAAKTESAAPEMPAGQTGFLSMSKFLKRKDKSQTPPLAMPPLAGQTPPPLTTPPLEAQPVAQPAEPALEPAAVPLPKKKGFKTVGPTAERLKREEPAPATTAPASAPVEPVVAGTVPEMEPAPRPGIKSSNSVGMPFSMTPLKNPAAAAKLPPLQPQPLPTPDNGEEFVSRPAPPNVPLQPEVSAEAPVQPTAVQPLAVQPTAPAKPREEVRPEGQVHPNNFFIKGVNDEVLQEKPKKSAFGSAPSSAPIVNPGGFTSAVVEEKSEDSMPVAPSALGGAAMPPPPGKIAAAPVNFFTQEKPNQAPDAEPRFRLVAVAEVKEEEPPIVLPALDQENQVGLPFGLDKNERVARPAAEDFPVMEPLPEGTVIEKRAVPFKIKARAFTERPQDRKRRS